MGKVAITPLMRAAWHEMMAQADPKVVSAQAVRVGIQIGTYFNDGTAETYVGLRRISKELKISERSAWASVHALKKAGLLLVRRGGRATNFYGMPLEKVATECEIRFAKSRNRVRDSSAEISQNRVGNLATGCEQTLTSTKLKDSTRGAAGDNVTSVSMLPSRWEIIKRTFPPNIIRAWLDRLAFVSIADGAVTLAAGSRFLAGECQNRFADQIADAWRNADASISSVKIIVHATTTAPGETPQESVEGRSGTLGAS